jgi:hypothetical protein
MVAINGIQQTNTQYIKERAMFVDQQFINDESSIFSQSSINLGAESNNFEGNVFDEGNIPQPDDFGTNQNLGDAFKSFGKSIAESFTNLFG